jgi:homoserine O-succinyltransferase
MRGEPAIPAQADSDRAARAGWAAPARTGGAAAAALTIGLVNNMPDAALAQTERQFRALIAAAVAPARARIRLFSLPGVPRGEAVRVLMTNYMAFDSIARAGLDLLVVTGTEPRAGDLRAEPYWPALTWLLDWAQAEGVPMLLSCLAAHAAVLHADGIARVRLADKRFGVFAHTRVAAHPLTRGLPEHFVVPHSRWHEVPAAALAAAGWEVLTQSPVAGVDLFARRGRSLTLCCQGHPEYAPDTLAREYRRDVRRFLAGERADYPAPPQAVFAPATLAALADFRASALRRRDVALLAEWPKLPAEAAAPDAAPPWQAAAATVWRNLLADLREEQLRHA